MRSSLFALSFLAVTGCASLQPPPTDAIAGLPVVRVGSEPPKDSQYVVFYPAGFLFPVRLKTSGSLFTSERQVESRAALARDLYLYKYWASHDGMSWRHSHELLGVEFGGGFDIGGLQSSIKLDAR